MPCGEKQLLRSIHFSLSGKIENKSTFAYIYSNEYMYITNAMFGIANLFDLVIFAASLC